jgi:hypothetical protein
LTKCRAKINGRICERGISPSRPDDLLCGSHWMAKYGHTWEPNLTRFAKQRICERCATKEILYGQLSFKLCTNPRNSKMELYTDDELKAKLRTAAKPLRNMTDAEKILYWIARARIAERELERRYYDSLENV